MLERKNDRILSLDIKKLLILHLIWKINGILQYGSLLFIMGLILVRIWRDNLAKYGRTITKFFISTVLTRDFGASVSKLLSKLHIKILAKAGFNGDLIATPTTCF